MSKTLEERVQALEDREAIIQLKARYTHINDGGWKGPTHTDPAAIADMFTEDGVWDGAPSAGYAKGRDAIKALFEGFRAMRFVIHYVSNPLIQVDGDTATGHWHALVTSTMPEQGALWILGYYKDEYVRTADGWKFKTLRFETAALAPYETGWAAQHA